MRMFIFLIAVALASAMSFVASAERDTGLVFKSAETQAEAAGVASRCTRKIALGPGGAEVACLMQKRKGRA